MSKTAHVEVQREFPQEAECLRASPWLLFGGVAAIPGATDQTGRLVYEFVPTRYELAELAKHYVEVTYRPHKRWIVHEETSSTEQRMEAFALRRLNTIESILGEEETRRVLADLEERNDKFLAAAHELCEQRGVTCLFELPDDDPELARLRQDRQV